MPTEQEKTAAPDGNGRLESWKGIAVYLGREVRTVQRWEKYEGLPVHRLPHEKRGSVFAYRDEIERWRAERQRLLEGPENGRQRTRRTRLAIYLAAPVVLLLLGAGAWFYARGFGAAPATLAAPATMGRLLASSTGEGQSFRVIPVGRTPHYLALSPDGAEIWVAAEGMINVVHAASEKVTHTIPLPGMLVTLVLSKDGRLAYAGHPGGELLVIDARSKRVLRTRGGLGSVTSLALTPDGRYLYLGGTFRPLKKMDTESGVISDVLTASCPVQVAISPDGRFLFINYQCSGPSGRPGYDSIEVRELPSEKVLKTVDGLRNIGGPVAVSPDGEYVWAAGGACTEPTTAAECPYRGATLVHVLRRSDWTPVRTLFPPSQGTAISFLPDGSRVFVSGDVVNASTYRVTESIRGQWSNMVVAPDRRRAFAAGLHRDAVAVFDLQPASCVRPVGLAHLWAGDGATSDSVGADDASSDGMEFAPGKMGQAFAFTRGESFFQVPKLQYVGGLRGEVTFVAWLKVAREGEMTVLQVTEYMRGTGWWLSTTGDGRLLTCFRAPCAPGREGALVSTSRLVTGRWHHVALRLTPEIEGGGFETAFFLDGAVEDRSTVASLHTLGKSAGNGRARPGDGPFRGLLDEVALFWRALNDTQIKRLATDPAPVECVPWDGSDSGA